MQASLKSWRWMAVAALALAYAALAHYTNTASANKGLGTSIALAPLALGALTMAWHSRQRNAMLAICGLGFAAFWMAWNTTALHFSLISWMEHAGTELLLCLAFARTLAAGREPMCTQFARVIHGGSLPPEIERYTRQLTMAWALFFGSMAIISTVLYHAAPLAVWSAFANFLTGPLICLMFIVEYAARRRLHPDFEHAHILDAVKAFWDAPAR